MSRKTYTPEKAAELDRLSRDLYRANRQAMLAIGTDRERETEAAAAAIVQRIKEIQGITGLPWEAT